MHTYFVRPSAKAKAFLIAWLDDIEHAVFRTARLAGEMRVVYAVLAEIVISAFMNCS